MTPTSHEVQRELLWLIDARYKLNPNELRPNGVNPKNLPKISVLRDNESYGVTLTWDNVKTTSKLSASEAVEVLRQDSRQLIDRLLLARFKRKSYIRRPLLIELQMAAQPEGVLVRPFGINKICCEPLIVFPWQNNHEFCCANSKVVRDARRANKMILAGTAQATSFPNGSIFGCA